MQALRGTQDILPDNIYKWNHVESVIKELCALYGYSEIRTPMFEDTKLFLRGIGDTTDVVAKEIRLKTGEDDQLRCGRRTPQP